MKQFINFFRELEPIGGLILFVLVVILVLVAFSLWNARRARIAAERVEAKVTNVGDEVTIVKKHTNSLTDQLVETTRTEAHAAGVLEEKERTE